MSRSDKNRQEIAAGLAWAAIGLGAIGVAAGYSFGTITRMGPGFVPITLGVLLVVLGGFAAWQGRIVEKTALGLHFRPFAVIMAGIVVWVVLIDRIGFALSTFALIAIAAQAEREITVKETLLLAVGVTLGGYLIFILGLGIPIALFGS